MQAKVSHMDISNGKLSRLRAEQRDPRLSRPPFSDNSVQDSVHHHALRVAQSFCNAVETCAKLQRRLCISVACGELVDAENATMTDTIRTRVT